MTTDLERVLAYHERTKHRPGRYAASLGYLDWASQPNPFRLYAGAELLPLARPAGDVLADSPAYRALFTPGAVPPAPLDAAFLGSLFYHALALSAWKQQGRSRWSLRVNPSSGNLHPTEAYLLAGPIDGLSEQPGLYHYSPLVHALERRAVLPAADWAALLPALPEPRLLVGLSSIPWRESWKYGERAFRYCNHDVGHAIAALAFAAALHGWRAELLDHLTEPELAVLLGLQAQGTGVEAELPECLLALVPATAPRLALARIPGSADAVPTHSVTTPRPHPDAAPLSVPADAPHSPAASLAVLADAPPPTPARTPLALAPDLLARLAQLPLAGEPNRLSDDHHDWPILADVAAASARRTPPAPDFWDAPPPSPPPCDLDAPASAVIRRRRSAVAMDGRTGLAAPAFYDLLLRTLPGGQPFTALPWRPAIDLALLVHRVDGLDPGLYLLMRDPTRLARWRAAADPGFAWERPAGCPDALPLYCLRRGDARRTAAFLSCAQDIAADGAFSLGMLADFRGPLERHGPAMYRRLFWETGAIGQVLYLEAEALGISGTGIGCFFDDVVHELLGLTGDTFQSLYHFTIGGRVDDPRLRTLDPYHHLEARDA